MINLVKNQNGRRKNLFNECKALGLTKTFKTGLEVIVIQNGENVANIYENGNVLFSGFKNISEVVNTVINN